MAEPTSTTRRKTWRYRDRLAGGLLQRSSRERVSLLGVADPATRRWILKASDAPANAALLACVGAPVRARRANLEAGNVGDVAAVFVAVKDVDVAVAHYSSLHAQSVALEEPEELADLVRLVLGGGELLVEIFSVRSIATGRRPPMPLWTGQLRNCSRSKTDRIAATTVAMRTPGQQPVRRCRRRRACRRRSVEEHHQPGR